MLTVISINGIVNNSILIQLVITHLQLNFNEPTHSTSRISICIVRLILRANVINKEKEQILPFAAFDIKKWQSSAAPYGGKCANKRRQRRTDNEKRCGWWCTVEMGPSYLGTWDGERHRGHQCVQRHSLCYEWVIDVSNWWVVRVETGKLEVFFFPAL